MRIAALAVLLAAPDAAQPASRSLPSSETTGAGQAGVPCYYDWTTAPRQHFMIADSPEYQAILAACRQERADTVPWDQHIRTFQTAADMRALAGGAQTNLLRLVEMLRKEREHLEAVRMVRRAIEQSNTASPHASPPDSNVRYFDLGPMLTEPVGRPDRLTVAPEFRAWVPEFLRTRIADAVRVHGRIVHFEGEARLRRGDSAVNLSQLLQRGNTWSLRPGDVFEVTRGRLVIEYDGKRYEVRDRGTIGIDLDEQCMTQTTHGSGGRQRVPGTPVYLIEGTILYMTTTTDVRQACVITTPEVTVSIRGTSFTATHTPTEASRAFDIAVASGSVILEDRRTGGTLTLGPGDSRQLMQPGPTQAPPPAAFQYDWDVQNNCTHAVEFKLFELDLRDAVVGSWKTVSIAAGGRTRIPISPTPGGKVCWGAAARQANLEWGVGLDGAAACERCCSKTLEATAQVTRTANLTCPGK